MCESWASGFGHREPEPVARSLELNIRNPHPGEEAAVTAGLAEALAPLLLEDAQLRAPRFAVDDADHLGIGDEGGAGHDVSRVLFDEQHLVERECRPGLAGDAVDLDDSAGRYLDLPATGLNNRVHEDYLS